MQREHIMGYLQDLDAWLSEELENAGTKVNRDNLKREIKQKILESYRNGQRDCPACNPKPSRGGERPERRRSEPRKAPRC